MVNQSAQMAAHVVNCLQASGVVVLYQKLSAVAMVSIAVQTGTPVMLRKERVQKVSFVPMVNQSAQMAAHVVNCLQASGVVVLYQKLSAVAMVSIAVQTGTPVMLQKERVPKEKRLQYHCQRRSQH